MVREKLKALKDRIGGDNLGPDRGTRDQLEARKERARIEAKREAQRERRQEQIEQARQQGRRQRKGFVERLADGIENATDQLDAAGGDLNDVDIDDDGTGLGDELADMPEPALASQVDENTEDINELEQQFDGEVFDEGGGSGGGGGFASADPFGDAQAPFERDDDDDNRGGFL
jgi:hypothetical protein